MNDNKITIADIARKLNISKSTVSKALSNATDVSEKTRERVLSCASEMGYNVEPDAAVKEKNFIIFIYGINYGDVDQFAYEVILGFQAAANSENVGVQIVTIDDYELRSGKYYAVMKSRNYEGSFFIGFKPHKTFIEHVRRTNLPIVVLDNYFDSPLVARVGCDNQLGMRHMVRYLYKMGHRRIAFLSGEPDSNISTEREQGYRETLQEAGIPPEEILIGYGSFTGTGMEDTVLELAKKNPTAICCASDIIACNCVRILKNAGIGVPEQISVTGYDDLPGARFNSPALTTVYQNRIHIGKTAFHTLRLLQSGIKFKAALLRPELVVRDSVRQLQPADTNMDFLLAEMDEDALSDTRYAAQGGILP